jgi:hypothetical protein
MISILPFFAETGGSGSLSGVGQPLSRLDSTFCQRRGSGWIFVETMTGKR